MSEAHGGGEAATQVLSDPHDRDEMLQEVLEGLSLSQKRIPSKYHYDARGSALFEEITRLDEYYPTRTERALLERWVPVWVGELDPVGLVELGPGSAEKTRVVLDAIVGRTPDSVYVPVDLSGEFLHETADRLRAEYPDLRVEPEVADISRELQLSRTLPQPCWIAFLGSTLGNFATDEAVRLLRQIRRNVGEGDRFLLGVDLRPGRHKSKERVELAYNDGAGVTEEFSLNVLAVLNRELGSDFDAEGFGYRSFYNDAEARIETYLESMRHQVVHFPGGTEVALSKGESIRTEVSAKYDRSTVEGLFARSGLEVDRWVEDDRGYYALVLAARATD